MITTLCIDTRDHQAGMDSKGGKCSGTVGWASLTTRCPLVMVNH